MKVKTISRNVEEFTRSRSKDVHKVSRNINPELHPHEQAREYTRAVNSAKLERMFAKPFVGALEGHKDGVYTIAKHPTELACVASGACDGEVVMWNLTNRTKRWSLDAHKGYVRGICFDPYGDHMYTCGIDRVVRRWTVKIDEVNATGLDAAALALRQESGKSYLGRSGFTGIDHHRKQQLFATSGGQLDVWDVDRSEPLCSMPWGCDTINTVRFNPVEVSVIASCGSDRAIALYDIRTRTALRKVTMSMKSNAICWNPIEAYHFTVANEDTNCYTFDMRKLDIALNVHKGSVAAVLDVDYSPTGQEFVAGAYDRTLRIYKSDGGHSREIYHTSRMQRIFTVRFTPDSKYILSGSDESNIRIWKAHAAERMGTLAARQKNALQYSDQLKERFKHHPKVKKIMKQRKIPTLIKKLTRKRDIMTKAEQRKDTNRRKHSKEGAIKHTPARRKAVLSQDE